jgi:DMSO reductase anchor subunit
MKTLADFKNTPTYRFLKVLYFLILAILVYVIYIGLDQSTIKPDPFVAVAIILVVMEIIKRVIFYIAVG